MPDLYFLYYYYDVNFIFNLSINNGLEIFENNHFDVFNYDYFSLLMTVK